MSDAQAMTVWKAGKFVERDFDLVPVDDYVTSGRPASAVPKLLAGEGVDVLIDAVEGDLSSLAAIALDFPSFADGRSYSKAQLLRSEHAYQGELIAVGDVLPDQVALMLRVGFDVLEATHPVTRTRLAEAGHETTLHTQIAGTSSVKETSGERFSWRRTA
ncbi:MAG: DUF934 domain-containing protein [Pseudomonadota bacterium]